MKETGHEKIIILWKKYCVRNAVMKFTNGLMRRHPVQNAEALFYTKALQIMIKNIQGQT